MIREAIAFVDRFELNQQQIVKDWKGKKFVMINTIEEKDNLVYDKLEIIDNDSAMIQWIKSNRHYKNIIENLDGCILPSSINKAMGSSSGLATFSFFVFKLSEKNLGNMMKKIKKTKFFDEKDDEVSIETIHEILINAIQDLAKKIDGNFQYLDYVALIHVDKTRLEKWKTCTDNFIKEKMSSGKSTEKQHDGKCPMCEKTTALGTPIFLTNYDSAKIFLKHTTKNNMDGKGTPFLACSECVLKLNEFDKILKDYKIKILPLFVKPTEISDEIRLIKDDLDDDKNTFGFIFDQLKDKRPDKHIFDFYLFVKSNDYFFYDYITNYKWDLGNYTDFFNKDNTRDQITRQTLEKKITNVLSDGKWINYFDKIKGKDNLQTFMMYSMRQKIFDFVYRNQNTLTMRNIQDIVLFRIETEMRNSSINVKKCQESLNLFFNKHLLLNTEMNENMILLNRVKDAKNSISSGDREFEIRDDDEWAYFAGQLAYYLVSLSKSKNKNYNLLEPFTNKTTTKLVKITIEQLFERYKHEISINNRRFGTLATKVLSYVIERSFIELKIPFYVGVFDENIIYQRKEVSE